MYSQGKFLISDLDVLFKDCNEKQDEITSQNTDVVEEDVVVCLCVNDRWKLGMKREIRNVLD